MASDLAASRPENNIDFAKQQQELNHMFNFLLESSVVCDDDGVWCKEIATELREDTSYYLYLMKKRHGVVEQIYDDEVRYWDGGEYKPVSDADQEQFLKNARKIREQAKKDKVKAPSLGVP